MRKLTNFLVFTFTLIFGSFAFPSNAFAVCPVCTVAVGAGLGLSRYLGIDDSASGVWFGGLMVSLGLWSANWLKKKKIEFPYREAASILFWLVFTLVPLKFAGVIGHPFNTILGLDKLLFGVTLGALVFLFSLFADKKVRQIKGKQLFDFQKVVFPFVFLTLTSVIMFMITSVNISF